MTCPVMITAITAPAWPGIINKEDKTMANITSNNEDLLNKVKLIQPGVPIQFPTVKPGDLITAELINAIMRTVESLDKRVTALEGSSSVTVVPKGRLEVFYAIAPLVIEDITVKNEGKIKAGGEYIFIFSVTAIVDMETTYTVTPTINGNGSWIAELVMDGYTQNSQGNSITIPENGRKLIGVRVTVPDVNDECVGTLILSVTENTPGTKVTPGHAQVQVTVGEPPPTPVTEARVTLRLADSAASIVGEKVKFVRGNTEGRIQLNILFTKGGTYSTKAYLRNTSGWLGGSSNTSSFTIYIANQPNATVNKLINVKFTAGLSASDTELIFSVSGGDANIYVEYVLGLTVSD